MRIAAAISTWLVVGFFAVFAMGGPASADFTVIVEPDDFSPGTVLTNAFPGVTLTNQGGPESPVISKDGFSIFVDKNIATTGDRVFGKIQDDLPNQSISKQWDVGAGVTTLGSLRADFSPPAVAATIDLHCTDDDIAVFKAFDAMDNEIGSETGA